MAGALAAFYLVEKVVRQGLASQFLGGGVQGSLQGYALLALAGLLLGGGLARLSEGFKERLPDKRPLKHLALILGVARAQVLSLLFYGAVALYVPSFGDDLARSFFVDWLGWLHRTLGGAELALINK